MRRVILASLVIGTAIIAFALIYKVGNPVKIARSVVKAKSSQPYTVEKRVEQFGQGVTARLAPAFAAANVSYPPHEIAYVAFKDQRQLQVYARNKTTQPWRFITEYKVLAASGKPGPKLMEGDRQVPEGIYKAEFLNANSRFHLAIRLNYPNDFDRRMALNDNRTTLGGDIMIHGNQVSIGCLAMGDQGAEDLFILAAQVGKERTRIVVAPTDFRVNKFDASSSAPSWTGELYKNLRAELRQYPRPVTL